MERVREISAWFRRYWPRIHTLSAPYGVGLSTLLLSIYLGDGNWRFWQTWDAVGNFVDLGAVIYAIIAISTEVLLTMVFYALGQINVILEKRKNRQDAVREEGREAERKFWQEWYDRQIANGVQSLEPPPTSPRTDVK